MKSLKLLLTNGITFPYALYTVCVYLINSVESSTTHLPNYIIPKHYDIYLYQATVNSEFFVGESQILLQIDRPTQNIYLHAQSPQIEIRYFILNNTILPNNYTYDNESHIFDIYFIEILSKGYYILKAEYYVYPDNEEGLFTTSFVDKKGLKTGLTATVSQDGARRMFACFDEPMFKATFNITTKHFVFYRSLSNMPAKNIETQRNMILTSFETTPVIPTYAVGITLIRLTDSSFHKIILYHKGQSPYIDFVNSHVINTNKYMESKKWKDLNIDTLKLVITPEYPYESREYFRLIIYRESAVIYDKELDPFMCKINVARIVTRAVIYEWVTNLVPLSQSSHAWINQGVSSLIAADIINKIYPESRMSDLFAVQIRQESLLLDTDSIRKSLTSKANTHGINSFFFFNYLKAPAILSMLQYLLTNEVFWDGIKIFLNKPSANPDDLWTAMQTALDESFITQKFDVKKAIDPWIQLEHYPVLEVTQYNDSQNIKITLENYTQLNNELWIPVTTENFYIRSQDPIKWFKLPKHVDVTNFYFDKNIISLKKGYYRVNYPVTQWLEIAKDLNIHHKKVHVLNRAQIIDDAFYFLIRGKLSLIVFLEVVKYLQNEMDYIAWYPMFKALEYLSCFIPFYEYNYALKIKIYMKNILDNLLDKIGYSENNNDDDLLKCLRQEAVKWACNLGHSKCKENAFNALKIHLSESLKPLPWWTKWTYCNGLMTSYSDKVWWTVFNIWKNASNNRLLEVLSCSESPDIVTTYLKIIGDTSNCTLNQNVSRCKDENNGVNERIISFLFTIAKNVDNNKILQYILDNFDTIKPRQVNKTALLIVIINHIYSKKSLDQVTKFVIIEENKKNKEIIDVTHKAFNQRDDEEIYSYVKTLFKQAISSIQDKIKMRETEITEQKLNFYNTFVDESEI